MTAFSMLFASEMILFAEKKAFILKRLILLRKTT
jgi:hypothetical protein